MGEYDIIINTGWKQNKTKKKLISNIEFSNRLIVNSWFLCEAVTRHSIDLAATDTFDKLYPSSDDTISNSINLMMSAATVTENPFIFKNGTLTSFLECRSWQDKTGQVWVGLVNVWVGFVQFVDN